MNVTINKVGYNYRLQKQWLLRESTTMGCHVHNKLKMAKTAESEVLNTKNTSNVENNRKIFQQCNTDLSVFV